MFLLGLSFSNESVEEKRDADAFLLIDGPACSLNFLGDFLQRDPSIAAMEVHPHQWQAPFQPPMCPP